MYSWVTVKHLIDWTGGTLVGALSAETPVPSISTDSRSIKAGEVFAAIDGETFDGHNFVNEVGVRGAALAIVQRPLDVKIPQLRVKDTLGALVAIASALRAKFQGPVCAVTGSAGKSSTKEMVATLLGENTVASPASYNNLLGVSKTLFLITDSTRQLDLEMGMNAQGEIAEMCRAFQPRVGCITNIGDAHLGKLGSQRNIQLAKKELFDHLATLSGNDVGVALNLDDRLVREAYDEAFTDKVRTVTYSREGHGADIRISKTVIDPESGFLSLGVDIFGEARDVRIPIFGNHQSQNIAAALAVATLMGVAPEALWKRLGHIRPAAHRGEVHDLGERRVLIDESYNSNPTALRSSLETLFALANDRRRVLVLGDMLELGEFSAKLHREVGERILSLQKQARVPVLCIGVGKAVGDLLAALGHTPGVETLGAESWEQGLGEVRRRLAPGDLVLVKGSRGNKLDRLVEGLLGSPS